jgi:hypothetical protein
MERIHLATVLAEIDLSNAEGAGRSFSLEYRKTDGKKGSKASCRKGGISGVGTGPTPGSRGFGYSMKEKGTLLVVDDKTNKPLTLKICLLTHYNGKRILHF